MMVAFCIGCGVSLIAAAAAPSLIVLAVALFVLGTFAAIYHLVGTAMVIENATHRGRTSGVQRRLRQSRHLASRRRHGRR